MFRLCFHNVRGNEIFGHCPGFIVKYSVSELYLYLVLSSHMNVLILNLEIHMNKPQEQF